MDPTHRTSALRRTASLLIGSALGLTPLAHGQQTAPPPAPAPAAAPAAETGSGGEVVKLSPFEVDASNDIGYYAENTLSGSRLNTNVGDLAASITVVTKQQLQDTGSLDINDVFLYEANTEGAGTYTPFYLNRGNLRDGIGSYTGDDGTTFGIATANRVRGLGRADTAQNNYPTIAEIPFDSYNTNTVEINRGPNSMLFGTGSPAGIVNQSTSEAVLGQTHTTVTGRFGSYGAWRASVATNLPIGDKVAVFAAALYDKRGFQREPSADTYKRQYVAATFQPFPTTKITASWENYDNFNNRPNFMSPADWVTPWIEAGRPGFNPATQMITFLDGGGTMGPYLISTLDPRWNGVDQVGNNALTNLDSSLYVPGIQFETHHYMNVANNQIIDGWFGSSTSSGEAPANSARTPEQWVVASVRPTWSRGFADQTPPASSGATAYGAWYEKGVTDRSLYDWEEYNILGANFGTQEAKTYNLEFQQQITPSLNLSVGWFRQELDEWTHYGLGQTNQPSRLIVDTNSHLMDGTPNPFFGTPMTYDYHPDTFNRPQLNNNLRGMLAYELDFTDHDGWSRWLGRHRFLGLGTQQKTTVKTIRYTRSFDGGDQRFLPNQNTNPPNNYAWARNATNLQERYYLGRSDNGSVNGGVGISGEPGFGGIDHATFHYYDWPNEAWQTTNMQFDLNNNLGGVTRKQIDSSSVAWQAYLWDDRIVATLGWRKDRLKITSTDLSGLRTSDLFENGYARPGILDDHFGPPYRVSGTTRTRGVVVKPFHRKDQGSQGFLADLINNFSFHYNESDNFNAPTAVKVDFFNNVNPKPSGTGKDYGIGTSLFDNKLVARLNWYESNNQYAEANAAGTAIGRVIRVDNVSGRGWAEYVVRIRHGEDPTSEFFANNTVTPLTPAMEDEIGDLWGLPYNWPDDYVGNIAGTESNTSKGLEAQIIYNPLRNWNIKVTAGQQKASYSDAVGELQEWIDLRKPQWEALEAPDMPAGEITMFNGRRLSLQKFWTGYGFSPDARIELTNGWVSPLGFYSSVVEGQIYQVTALQDTTVPNLREWSFNVISNYAFQEGPLKGFAVGGSVRWQDKAVAGYYGLLDPTTYARPNASTAVVVFPDLNRPIYTPSDTNIDLWVSYTTRLMDDRVRWKIQLNVRDVTENGGLQPVLFQMDGTPAQFRIKDPRQWFVTSTFDF